MEIKPPPTLNGNNHPDVLTIVALLDAHDIPPYYSVRQTQTWLQQQGHKYRQTKIQHALRRYREYYLPGLPTR